MLVQLGRTRTDTINRQLAIVLCAVAGALNAAAFYAAGFFAANMTGNVSSFSDKIALGRAGDAVFYSLVIVAFILGSSTSTLMINAGSRHRNRGIFALVILIEAVLLALLGIGGLLLSPSSRVPCIVLGLAFLMGLQNATVTRISDARVRTTHVSGMITDIGIELALLFDRICRREHVQDRGTIQRRLRLHVESVLSFFVGGIVGVVLYRAIGLLTLEVAAVVLAALALPALGKARQMPKTFTELSAPNDL